MAPIQYRLFCANRPLIFTIPWRLEGYVDNATDEIYATSVFVNAFSLNGDQFVSPPGRQYGLRLIKWFN